jgi:hypothetical protein
MAFVAIVVRLGPLPLGRRRASRVAELERILATAVEVVEVTDIAELASVVAGRDVAAVALDAPGPEDLADAIAAAGDRSGTEATLEAGAQQPEGGRRAVRRLRPPCWTWR